MMTRDALAALLDGWLEPGRFDDAAENGLQVEGRAEVRRVVCGVTASQALIDQAVAAGADAVVVHHGLVWGGGIRRLTGWLGRRVATLLAHEVSLFAYHLPLDAHPSLGNNAGLAEALGVTLESTPFGAYRGQTIGLRGRLAGQSFADVLARVRATVGAPVCAVGDPGRPVATIGLCTGGAPELLHEAIDAGLDCYVTGEVTEWVPSVAAEAGVAFVAAGHHATERFGPRRLAAALVARGLDARFVDVPNPV
jgi:dinuclear metal center YbgI/SA1388 family protein